MKKHRLLVGGLVVVSLAASVLWSCSSDDEPTGSDFDRSVMLQHVAENIILPQYLNLQTKVNDLKNASDAFTTTVNTEKLMALQSAWKEAYIAFQYTNAFNFGPGGEKGARRALVEEVATFPASAVKIESRITANNTTMDSNADARGFLAIDYLIFNLDNNLTTVVDQFASDSRKQYLTAVVTKLKSQVDDVANAWAGGYTTEFVANNGTDVGSSVSQLFNEFVRSFEVIKNFKLGLPLGIRPGQVSAEPQLVEAYYSGISVTLVKAHITEIENIWYGRPRNSTEVAHNLGFKDYLQSVAGGDALIASTEAQLASIHAAMNDVKDNQRLSEQVTTNVGGVNTLYTELQKMMRYFKSDLSSLLGIAITFSSGDGD